MALAIEQISSSRRLAMRLMFIDLCSGGICLFWAVSSPRPICHSPPPPIICADHSPPLVISRLPLLSFPACPPLVTGSSLASPYNLPIYFTMNNQDANNFDRFTPARTPGFPRELSVLTPARVRAVRNGEIPRFPAVNERVIGQAAVEELVLSDEEEHEQSDGESEVGSSENEQFDDVVFSDDEVEAPLFDDSDEEGDVEIETLDTFWDAPDDHRVNGIDESTLQKILNTRYEKENPHPVQFDQFERGDFRFSVDEDGWGFLSKEGSLPDLFRRFFNNSSPTLSNRDKLEVGLDRSLDNVSFKANMFNKVRLMSRVG